MFGIGVLCRGQCAVPAHGHSVRVACGAPFSCRLLSSYIVQCAMEYLVILVQYKYMVSWIEHLYLSLDGFS